MAYQSLGAKVSMLYSNGFVFLRIPSFISFIYKKKQLGAGLPGVCFSPPNP
jgi:hypothetical protein